MRLVLIRHAWAVDRDGRNYLDDGSRPLRPEGREEHARVAAALVRLQPHLDHLISSPLVRARQTAEITAAAYGRAPEEIVFHPELGTDCARGTLLEVVQRYPVGGTLALVGHEPCLSFLASELLHSSGAVRVDFPTSGALGLDFDGPPRAGRGALCFFLRPQALPSGEATASEV